MIGKFDELMDKYILLILDGINYSTPDFNFTENIQLKKIIFDDTETYGLKLSLNEKFLDIIGESIPKKDLLTNFAEYWEELSVVTFEEYVDDYLMDNGFFQLTKLVDAINICKREPCEISKQIFYDGFAINDDIWGKPTKKFFSEIKGCEIEKDDIELIIKIWRHLMEAYESFPKVDYKKYWWLISIEYFERYPNAEFSVDQLIHLTIALESLLSGHNDNSEMRYRFSQRTSLFLYHKYHFNPKQIQKIVKEMYDTRSKIVHGSVGFRELENEFIKVYGNVIDLNDAINILRELMRLMLFESIINYSDMSKEKFLESIDSLWLTDIDSSKIKPLEYLKYDHFVQDGVPIRDRFVVKLKDPE